MAITSCEKTIRLSQNSSDVIVLDASEMSCGTGNPAHCGLIIILSSVLTSLCAKRNKGKRKIASSVYLWFLPAEQTNNIVAASISDIVSFLSMVSCGR